jgi:hypothetical protein
MLEAVSAHPRFVVKHGRQVVNVLVLGAGVIGSVYGAHLGAAGHAVSVVDNPAGRAAINVQIPGRVFLASPASAVP